MDSHRPPADRSDDDERLRRSADERLRRSADERLRPYVASLSLTWLRDAPASTWREVEGSLAFVDISGFTRLTERLAGHGKGGAEEMSGILDATFSQLLWVAYSYGAQLVKWGGDAVLLLFTGDEHAARACRAAHEMRATMREIGRLTTSAGRVTLRMSVGIHSGTFHFFLVGSQHHELIVTGPGATTAAAVEGIAEAGEIGLSPQTAALLDPSSVGAEKAPGVLLLRRAPSVEQTPRRSTLDLAGIDVGSCLPSATREHLLAGGTDGEHRQIAVAFVEFKQTDALLAAQGPAALAHALQHVVSTTQEACTRRGVTFWETDISPDGGKIMLVGGAPRSIDDDAGAMLATVRDVVDAGGALPVRVGVNYGRVFSGGFGPAYRRTFSAKGDAINLAARVMGKAAPGEIWATDSVLARSRLTFESEALPPFMVKGKAKPVVAHRLGRVMRARISTVDDEPPLLGRDRELATLLAAAKRAREGAGSVVEIVGEPGIGKSRLLAEVERSCADMRVLHIACDAYRSATPYSAMRSLLRDSLDVGYDADRAATGKALRAAVQDVAPGLADWLPLLAVVAEADAEPTTAASALDEKFRKARLEQATAELLAGVLAGPTLVVIEDVHLIDDASGDVLSAIATAAADRQWTIVVSRRTSPGGFTPTASPHHTRIDLVPLDGEAARSVLMTASDDAPLRPQDLALLAERAEGNPLFLLQLVDAVRRTGSTDGLPDSVEGVITARIDQLAPAERRWLRTAAVLGVQFDPQVLLEVLTTDGDEPDLTRLGEFLDLRGGEGSFRHALVRDTAYEGLPFTRRRDLHAKTGEVLEARAGNSADAHADLLSLHFLRAELHEKAWHYACIAARRARDAYAYIEAATFYERAIAAAPHVARLAPTTIAETYEALGDMRVRALRMDDAFTAYALARKGFRTRPLDLARVQWRTAVACDFASTYSAALRWLSLALRSLDRADAGTETATLRARTMAHYGFVLHHQGREEQAAGWSRRAAALADEAGASDALAIALTNLYVSLVVLGRPDRSTADRALQLWSQLDEPWEVARLHNYLGGQAYYEGDWDEAIQQYEAGRAAAMRAGDEWLATICEANIVEVLSDRGDLLEAETRMENVRRMYRAFPVPVTAASGESQMGRILARAGRFDEAHMLYDAAMDTQRRHGAQGDVVETMARVAECQVWQREAVRALRTVDDALTLAASGPGAAMSEPLLHRVRGLALASVGRVAEARASLEHSLQAGRAHGSRHEVAWTLDALDWVAGLDGGSLVPELADERRALVELLGIRGIRRPVAPARVVLPAQRAPLRTDEGHPAR